jgi:hypothetical protein
MGVLLVPQAPPYSDDEAWAMYFRVEDAVATAVFAKEDLECVQVDREYFRSELRNTKQIMFKVTDQSSELRKKVEKLEIDLEEERRRHRKSEYNSQLYLHIASHFACLQFKNAVSLAKRGQLEE